MNKKLHWIQVGTAKVGFLAQDNYSDIGPVVGVAKLADADRVDAVSTVGNLFKSGQAVRLKVRFRVGTQYNVGSIVCDIDKAPSAIGGLIGKTYRGGEITSASIPRRRRLG